MIKNFKIQDIEDLKCKINHEFTIENKELFDKRTNKELYGEVFSPFSLIETMYSILPQDVFKNPNLKWLDPGSGTGNFSILLYFKLFEGLKKIFLQEEERKNHILTNMIYMVELREENVNILRYVFGNKANIIHKNYLEYNPDTYFDVIVGNPPFNINGIKKVPTNSNQKKKQDGTTIWCDFIKKSISLLNNNKYLCVFIPSIWLKPDKEKMYHFLLQYKIDYLNCYTNTETNKIFKGEAQTPSCFFLLEKKPNDGKINIYERKLNKYICYHLKKDYPIPICNIDTVNYFLNIQSNNTNNTNKTNKTKSISVIKTNLPGKNVTLSPSKLGNHIYPNIKTRLQKNKELVIEYSNIPLIGYGKMKIVLAHKMYGIPYLDLSGEYGISNRDNYIIYKDKKEDLIKLYNFLSEDKRVQEVYDSTRYRMKYLEKYAFQFLPDCYINY